MLITALEREKQRIFQDGLLEGKQEGKIEGKIEAAKEMLAKGIEITLVSEITNLPEEQLSQLKNELSSVADFSDNR